MARGEGGSGGGIAAAPRLDSARPPREAAASTGASQPPTIQLPKGGGAIRGIGEKFAANPVTGTGSLTIPLAISPGRSGFGPQLSLSYDSGSGNGPFGIGWGLSLPAITRKTDKGLPRYEDAAESDVFILSGSEDLVPVLNADGTRYEDRASVLGFTVHRYRPRIEGLFARIERWTRRDTGEAYWRSISRDNVTTWYGRTSESRIADPRDPARVFSWLICASWDDKGNAISYEYAAEDSRNVDRSLAHERNRDDAARGASRYLKRIRYGNKTSRLLLPDPADLAGLDWHFQVVFDYGEGHYAPASEDGEDPYYVQAWSDPAFPVDWAVRQDPFSSYRAGFEARTYRLCRRVLMFHEFDALGTTPCLVKSMAFDYDVSPSGSFVASVVQSGYVRQRADAGTLSDRYLRKSLPPVEFEYSLARIDPSVREVEGTENLPAGVDGSAWQWVDLDGEGLSGALTEQARGWFYKRNASAWPPAGARLGALELVSPLPAAPGLASGRQQFLDLAGDGRVDVVELGGSNPGYFERTAEGGWTPHTPFRSCAHVNWKDPNLRFVDLTGDGHADVLITEGEAFTWYPSLAEEGFGPATRMQQALDESEGPRLVFADGTQSIYLADMSGDGLTDLVRIRNGEVSYWPNLGHCRWGRKVSMDHAPWFDHADQFDHRRVRLADIDGSGTSDVLYLGAHRIDLYRNLSGNGWGGRESLSGFPPVDSLASITATDLLGNGTACLVWSSPLPGTAGRAMRYVDLMSGGKPHLLTRTRNNLGAETRVTYSPSTRFHLEDEARGRPWLTRLPFPVHVVERVETRDHVSGNRFVTRYAYHHGYFDGAEREFRGFGMVEQWDTEEFGTAEAAAATNLEAAAHAPPVLTRTWFHTGVHIGRGRVSDFFAGLPGGGGEYYREPAWRTDDAEARRRLLPDTILPAGLTPDEEREACRALKGSMLRQEVYALDGKGSPEYPCGHPYTVTEQSFGVLALQARTGANRHAVFFVHPREALSCHYERNPADPRVSHSMTLEVDARFGEVLKSLSVGYGRRASPLQGDDKRRQERTLVTYTENGFTNAIGDVAATVDRYRAPLPCETRTYEITGLGPAAGALRLDFEALVADGFQALRGLQETGYEDPADPEAKRRRLIERVRTRYRPDDMGASRNDAQALLPLGTAESLALPGETCKLAFTAGLVDRVYRRGGQPLLEPDAASVLAGGAGAGAGYVESDGGWWIPSGRAYYDAGAGGAAEELASARRHFFVPRRYRDPFHVAGAWDTETFVEYDAHDLLVRETRDAAGNRITVGTRGTDDAFDADGNDYRVLQPRLMTDANRNRSEVAFDALGLVAATAVMGKPDASPAQGDLIAPGFVADPAQAELDAFYGAADPHGPAPALLGVATTRILYDIDRYRRRGEPVYAASLARETHASDALPPHGLRVQISFSYSDGFGREIQKKIQAEPGAVPQRDAEGRIRVGADGQPLMGAGSVDPRWVGSGWTVYNNKGKPVRQFEPFFSDTHRPDFDVRIGVSPVLFYDPVERVVATLHPNNTYEKVVYDPWRQSSHDVNDTVALDPRSDPDVAALVAGHLAGQPPDWRTWLQQRVADPGNPPSDTGGAQPERDAAVRALAHAGTPTTTHFDALGRTFLTVADNGRGGDGMPRLLESRVEWDIEGNQREVRDARHRTVMRYDYDLLGNRIRQASMEAGERWMLNDVAGKPLRAWDGRGHRLATEYDRVRRPILQRVRGTDAARSDPRTLGGVVFAKTEYGEGQAGAADANLRARVFRQYDGAGVVTHGAYDFKGNLLESVREMIPGHADLPDWAAQQPAGEVFRSSTAYDALNRPVSLVAPDGSAIRPRYNAAGLLEALEANLRGAAVPRSFVTGVDYNAKAQRVRIDYGTEEGAGITTTFHYDPSTFRLLRLVTRRNAGGFDATDRPGEVQNLSYAYDPAGNITHIHDAAQDTVFFANRRVEPGNDYRYDAVYRLIEATGREHLGQSAAGAPLPPAPASYGDHFRLRLPQPGDGNAMGAYRETYAYDEAGNFAELTHRGSDPAHPGWTRRYTYDEPSQLDATARSNRLSRTAVSGVDEVYSAGGDGYDAHGNMLHMPHLQELRWDFQDRLLMTRRHKVDEQDADGALRHGERTWYVYDAGGQRVRKVTERPGGGVKDERIYVGSFEVYRAYGANALERETLHIMDDKQRIALVETKTAEGGVLGALASLFVAAAPLVRYQFGNHLGSACLELDDRAQVISYEEYTPYGSSSYQGVRQDVEVPAKRYRYTGKERDEESGFYYFRARYYASWVCRWTCPDPAGLADGPNTYSYVTGNPVVMSDKTGLQGENVAEDLFLFLRNDAAFAEGKANPQVIDEAAARANASKFGMKAQERIEQSIQDARAAGVQGADQVYSEVAVKHGTGEVTKIGGSPVAGAHNLDLVKMPAGSAPLKEGDVLGKGGAELVGDVKHGKGSVTAAHADFGSRGGVTVGKEVKPRRSGYTPPTAQGAPNAPQKSAAVQLTPKDAVLDRSTGQVLAKETKVAEAGAQALEKTGKGARALAKLGKAARHLAAAVPILGVAAGQASAAHAASQGDYVGAALDEAGLIPVVGDVLDAGRAGYALGEAANEALVDQDLAMKHGDVAKGAMQKLGAGETLSNVVGGLAAAGSALGQVMVKASPLGFMFW